MGQTVGGNLTLIVQPNLELSIFLKSIHMLESLMEREKQIITTFGPWWESNFVGGTREQVSSYGEPLQGVSLVSRHSREILTGLHGQSETWTYNVPSIICFSVCVFLQWSTWRLSLFLPCHTPHHIWFPAKPSSMCQKMAWVKKLLIWWPSSHG